MTFFLTGFNRFRVFRNKFLASISKITFFSVHLLNASNGAGSDDASSCFHLALKSSQNGPKNLTFFDRLQSIQFFSKQVLASTWKMIFSLLVYLMLLMALVCFHLALRIVKMAPKIWPFLTRFNRFSFFRNKFQHQFQKNVFSCPFTWLFHLVLQLVKMTAAIWYLLTRLIRCSISRNKCLHRA